MKVYLDGRYAFQIGALAAQEAQLRPGLSLSEEQVQALLSRDALHQAWDRALNFLSYRPRSVAEVRRHLGRAKVAPELLEPLIARLKEAALLDDLAFARYWADNRSAFNPRSRRALAAELRQKGLEREIIDQVLRGGHDDEESALAAARRQARRLAGLDYRSFQQKLSGYLARRGYDYETIRATVHRLWQERQEAPL